MKKNLYTSIIRSLCWSLLPLLFTACTLYEHPELTDEGEEGVDPTLVSLTADIKINLDIEALEFAAKSVAHTGSTRAGSEHRHRFVVEAREHNNVVARQVIYEDINPDRSRLDIPISMKLHARNYQLAIWADYVAADSEEDLFYETQDLSQIIYKEPYKGNEEFRDLFYACRELDLTGYRNNWNAKVQLEMEMVRPLARYELRTNDTKKFLERIAAGEVTGSKFTVTVQYNYYLPLGFNIYTGRAGHSLMYMEYSKTYPMPTAATDELTIAFDWIFAAEDSYTPVTVIVKDERNNEIARTHDLQIPYKPGRATIVRSNFLTANSGPGINIDPEFEGDIDIDLDL